MCCSLRLQQEPFIHQDHSALGALGTVEPALLCLATTCLAGFQVSQSVPSRNLPHCPAESRCPCARAVPAHLESPLTESGLVCACRVL